MRAPLDRIAETGVRFRIALLLEASRRGDPSPGASARMGAYCLDAPDELPAGACVPLELGHGLGTAAVQLTVMREGECC